MPLYYSRYKAARARSLRSPGPSAWTGRIWWRRSSASASSAPCSTSSPTSGFWRCWKNAGGQIAQGLANAEKIKAELDRTESQRQEVMAQAHAQAAQFIEEARASAARLRSRKRRKRFCRRTDHG